MKGRALVLTVLVATAAGAGALYGGAGGARGVVLAAQSDVSQKIKELSSADATRRAAAACALASMETPPASAVPSLVRLLSDDAAVNPELICYRGIEPSTGGEFEGLRKPSPGEAATQALIAIGGPAVEPLIEALKDKHPQARKNAAWALTEIRDDRAADALVRALGDETWQVRAFAAMGLGELRSEQVVGPLVAAFESEKNPQVRWYAAASLGQFRDPRVVEPLIAALRDGEPRVRAYAAASLGQAG
ncbi:MAG: HEAT repeat domain-containing protein, partial [Pyrinomonadaceae bacterium]